MFTAITEILESYDVPVSAVRPEDKQRYLEYFDLDTLKVRAVSYIQQSFRVRSGDDHVLKNIRISKLDNKKYLYTIQSV